VTAAPQFQIRAKKHPKLPEPLRLSSVRVVRGSLKEVAVKYSLYAISFMVGLMLAVPQGVQAGVLDSPIPVIKTGSSARSIYIIPGVTKNNGLETEFICTNMEKAKSVTVAVELFASQQDPLDTSGPLNDVTPGSSDGNVDLPVGASATISTGSTVGFHEDDIIVGITPIVNIRGGSARILSTSKRIACSVLVVEDLGSPPATMAKLNVINRKQGGD